MNLRQYLNLAIDFHIKGNVYLARKNYLFVVIHSPNSSVALGWLGTIEAQLKNYSLAKKCLQASIVLDFNNYNFNFNYANLLQDISLYNDAITVYLKLLYKTSNFLLLINISDCYIKLQDFQKSLFYSNKALYYDSYSSSAWINRALAFDNLGSKDSAYFSYIVATVLDINLSDSWNNLGLIHLHFNRFEYALLFLKRAIYLNIDSPDYWYNRGIVLSKLNLNNETLVSYKKSLILNTNHIDAWINYADSLSKLKQHDKSAESYLKANKILPNYNFVLGRAHHQLMLSCDWSAYSKFKKDIDLMIVANMEVSDPFGYQGIAYSEYLLGKSAEIYCNKIFPQKKFALLNRRLNTNKIKIAYLCGEFRNQATTHLLIRTWELHNSNVFELYALDNGWDDNSEYRKRINKAFPNLISIKHLTDLQVSTLIQELGIHLLINLNGYFGRHRQGVFSYKPAPISVNYLGFPGTIGSNYIDYLIADKIVIPKSSVNFYKEKIVYLPNSYQPNDDLRPVSKKKFHRSDFNLPTNKFVYCCFNNHYKITPDIFLCWMKILKSVDHSCLWLIDCGDVSRRNLINHACYHGVNPSRLIFSNKISPEDHIARHKLADLFLDTSPYNAHTTASDCLWGELPLVTLLGSTFPGRVSASLLQNLGLPELITRTYDEYVSLSIKLAEDQHLLSKIKNKLVSNKANSIVFDSSKYTKNLESAYITMYERNSKGLIPEHFEVNNF